MIIDSHCHLQFKAFDDDREEVIKKCQQKQTEMILVGTQQDTSKKAVELADQNDGMYSTVGLHPIQSKKVEVEEENASFVAKGEDFDSSYYQSLIDGSESVVAIGETGLDKFHVPQNEDVDKILDDQWSAYMEHVKLARENDLPVIMHIRDAHDEMISRLEDINIDYDGVIHCYTSDWEHAQQYLDLGFNISFTGIITFPPKSSNPQEQRNLWEVVEKVPLSRVLVETDAPFLAPQRYRGDKCEPWMTLEVVKKIAELKDISVKKVKKQTVKSTKRLFGISP